MSRIKDFYNKYLSRINAYWLVTIVFFALTFIMGDSSLYKRYTYDEKIRNLEKEIKHYQKEIEINSKKLNDLHTDKEGLERFAREEYFMKKPNEDVYIIKNGQLSDNAYPRYGFSQAQIAPLQHICRVAVYIRLRPDVQRTERMDDLPDYFSPASVIHGICHP